MSENEAKPCPNCGHCPTCGHTPYQAIPYYPVYPYTPYPNPWWNPVPDITPIFPGTTWSDNIGGTTKTSTTLLIDFCD